MSSLSSRRTASSTLQAKDVYDEDNLHKLEGFYANWLMYMDGKQHAEIRRAVVRALNKSVTEDVYAYARSLARDLIKGLARESSVNLLDELIMPYCGKLMLRVLGIPGLTYDELLELTENIVGFLGMSSFDSSVADKVLSDIVRLEKVIDSENVDEDGFVHLFLQEVADFNLSKQALTGLLGNMLVDETPKALNVAFQIHL